MRTILVLAILTFTSFQVSHQRILYDENDFEFPIELSHVDSYNQRSSRDLSDVWIKIKSKINNAWETFKKITNNTKEHIKNYVEKIKEKIEGITSAFKNKLETLKQDFRKLIEKVAAAEESLMGCLKDDKDVIETLLKDILVNVTTCITNNMSHLSKLHSNDTESDDSKLLDLIENKISERLDTCDVNSDKCLHKVKEEIIGDLDNATWNVSYQALEVRNTADNILDLIVTCVTEGLTEASTSIFNETVQIIQCVQNKHEN